MDFWEKRNHTTDSCGPIAKITGHAFHDGIPICLDMKRCYLQDKARQAPDCFSCMKWQSPSLWGRGFRRFCHALLDGIPYMAYSVSALDMKRCYLQ